MNQGREESALYLFLSHDDFACACAFLEIGGEMGLSN